MKTPREILLERHRAAEPKLDAIRKNTVAAVCDRRSDRAEVPVQRLQIVASVVGVLWRELFLPARRIWIGLAAAWLFIVVANLSFRADMPRVAVATPTRSADVLRALQEQQQLLAELTDRRKPKAAEVPKTTAPQPRSDLRNECLEAQNV